MAGCGDVSGPEPVGSGPADGGAMLVPQAALAPASAAEVVYPAPDPDHQLSGGAAALVARGLAANTRAAYERHWAAFQRWCHLRGRTALPATAQTLAEYVHHLTGTTTQYGRPPSASTISHVLGCIQAAHKHAGRICDVRLARLALRAYRRDGAGHPAARRPRRQSAPVTLADLRALVHAMLAAVGAGDLHPLKGQRDQVALVLGFAMAGRASEVAALDIADLTFSARGLTITVRSSKTDQDARGTPVHIKYGRHLETCPVRLTEAWIDSLAAHGVTGGPLLRGVDQYGRVAGTAGYAGRTRQGTPGRLSNETLNTLIRDAVRRVHDAGPGQHALEEPLRYSWHGLRAGFATSAAEGGAAPTAIADHGRWKGLLMVMHYWRGGTAWANDALDKIDL